MFSTPPTHILRLVTNGMTPPISSTKRFEIDSPYFTRKKCTTDKIKTKLLNMAKNIEGSLIKCFRELSSVIFLL